MAVYKLDTTQFIANCIQDLKLIARNTIFDLTAKVMKRTPIDTGILRANWQVGEGAAPTGIVDSVKYIGENAKQLVKTLDWDIDKVLYVANNLPYANRIENGWSTVKSPQGMLKVSIEEFPYIVEQAKKAAE